MTGVYTVGRSVVEGLFRASEREEDRQRKGRGGETSRRGEKHVAQATRASLLRVAVYLSSFPPPASPPLVVLYRVVLLCCLVYRESSTPARQCSPSVGFTGVGINRLSACFSEKTKSEESEESVYLNIIEAWRDSATFEAKYFDDGNNYFPWNLRQKRRNWNVGQFFSSLIRIPKMWTVF